MLVVLLVFLKLTSVVHVIQCEPGSFIYANIQIHIEIMIYTYFVRKAWVAFHV